MQDNNFNNIYCSRICQDFILLYDGLGTYYLYHQDDLLLEKMEAKTPKEIEKENNLLQTLSDIQGDGNNFINALIKEISGIIGDNPKQHNKIKSILYDLISSLKNADTDPHYKQEYFLKAPQIIIDKAMEISLNVGYDVDIFQELVTPMNIEEEIQQRAKPVLTIEEKAKADEIAKQVNEMGLLAYLTNILDNIHIGDHKNIYRKILMLFKIMRGEASFLSETTAKAEAGKSFEDEIVFNLIAPQRYIFKVNDITSASFKRYGALNPYYFDRKIVLFGDLGSKKAFMQVEDVFNIFKVLITENEYNSSKADKNDDLNTIEINLKVNSVGAVYSTVENSFTQDDNQLISRTIFSTPAKVEARDIARQIFYQRDNNTMQSKAKAKAEQDLKDFGLYLMQMVNNDAEIINPYFDVFWDYASKSDAPIREFNQQLELFDAYCRLTQDQCKLENLKSTLFASEEQLTDFMDFVNLENALIPYEYDFLDMLLAKGKAKELTILYNDFDIMDSEGNLKDIDLEAIVTITQCENAVIEKINDRLQSRLVDDSEIIESKADLNTKQLKELPQKLLAIYGFRNAGADHKQNIFFRISDIKNYYGKRTAYKNIENVPQLLQSLHNKGYIGKYEIKQGKENLYYLTPMCNNLTAKFELKKSYNDYVMEYFTNVGYIDY